MMFTLFFTVLVAPVTAQVVEIFYSPPPPPAPSPPDGLTASGAGMYLSAIGESCDTTCKALGSFKCDETANLALWTDYFEDEEAFTELMVEACANSGDDAYTFKCNGCKTFKSSKFKSKGLPAIFPKKEGNQPQCEYSKTEEFTCYKGNSKRHLLCKCDVDEDADIAESNQEIGAAPRLSSFTLFASGAAIVAALRLAF